MNIMLGYLTVLSGFGLVLAFLILLLPLRKRDFTKIKKYCIVGLIGASIDFVLEYLGTSTGHWTYNESVYFIFDLIPIELVFIFFSGTIVAMFLFLNLNKISIPMKSNVILYILILIAFLVYVREMYQESFVDILPLSIFIGLWGLTNISDKNRAGALIVAIIAAVLDLVSEMVIIGSGSYSYRNGFSFLIPISYGLITLGILAIVEKINKLDEFLDHPIVKNLLKLFGVHRKK